MDTKPSNDSHPTSSERVRWLVRRSWDDYSIAHVLGKGACGIVYQLVAVTHPSDPQVVVKVAHGHEKHDDLILREWSIGSRLSKSVSRKQLPIVFYSARATLDNRPCIFLEQGIWNAYDYLSLVPRKTPKRVIFARIGGVASQLIHRLEQFHDLGYIHRDVKLENFIQVFVQHEQEYVFKLADLGLAMRYLDEAGHHIPSGLSSYVGTPAFSSKNADKGNVQSRRDDMESLAYSLIHVARHSNLPWSSKPFEEIKTVKAQTLPRELCQDLPAVFADFLLSCQQLEFAERPDYGEWRAEFAALVEVDDHQPAGTVDSCLPPCSQPASEDKLLRATSSSSGIRDSPPADQPPLSGLASEEAASLCCSDAQSPRQGHSVLQGGCWKKARAYQKPGGPGRPWVMKGHGDKAAQSVSRLDDGTRATAMAIVPHFARPTKAQLARQKPPIRVRQTTAGHKLASRVTEAKMTSNFGVDSGTASGS